VIHSRRLSPEFRRLDTVTPLELYFDLVFVLGFTQCTALMVHEPTWEGIARGMLVLALLWWAWVGYAWLTSVVEPEEGLVRFAMFGAMAALLIVALCVPEVFGDRAVAFAIAYGLVRAGQMLLFLLASRDDPGLRRSVLIVLAPQVVIVTALLLAASAFDGAAQGAIWVLAIVLDLGAPLLFGQAGWRLVPGHFAERHNLVIILALGESIVALGVGAEVGLSAGVIAAAILGIGLSSAIWWINFDVVALVTRARLLRAPEGRERNILARDSYSYLHFPMVAGIILAAFGLEEVLAHTDEPLHTVPAFALLGGVALYLLAHVALRLRNARTVNVNRLAVAVVLIALWPLALEVSGLVTLVVINVLLWAMIAVETSRYDDRRYRLRHGLETEIPGPSSGPGPER
jgi:low temperature requirement protein LtrA